LRYFGEMVDLHVLAEETPVTKREASSAAP